MKARSVVLSVAVLVALAVFVIPPPVYGGDYVWVISGGLDATTGHMLYGLATDGSSSSVVYHPSGLPTGYFMSEVVIAADGQLAYHVSNNATWPYNQRGEIRYGRIFTDEYILHSNDSDAAGVIAWVPGTLELLYSGINGGIEAYSPGNTNHRTLTTNYFDEVTGVTPGGLVFFENSLYRSPGDIFTMTLTGGNIQKWSPTGTDHERNARISPDGQYVAFYQEAFDGLFLATTGGTVINGTANPLVANATRHSADNGWFAWAPDSSAIAFIQGNEIWSVNRDGTNLTQLTHGEFAGTGGPKVWGGYPVPEPASFVLLAAAGAVFVVRWRCARRPR